MQYAYDEKIKEMDLANSVALKEHNQLRNRYCNVIPFDENRVKLSSSNDYINASHMHYELTDKHYIFSQGPLEHTSQDFWQMVRIFYVQIRIGFTGLRTRVEYHRDAYGRY